MRVDIDADQKHAIMTSLPGLPIDIPSFNGAMLRLASGIRFAQRRRHL
jgi:hypothetical protein